MVRPQRNNGGDDERTSQASNRAAGRPQFLSEPDPELLPLVVGALVPDPLESAFDPPESAFVPPVSDLAPDSEFDFDALESVEPESLAPPDSPEALDALGPLAEDADDRESLMYQPLPLKTMPTG